jgi:hypothetical protein
MGGGYAFGESLMRVDTSRDLKPVNVGLRLVSSLASPRILFLSVSVDRLVLHQFGILASLCLYGPVLF